MQPRQSDDGGQILEYKVLAAGLGILRQPRHPDDGGQILEYRLLAAGLGTLRQPRHPGGDGESWSTGYWQLG